MITTHHGIVLLLLSSAVVFDDDELAVEETILDALSPHWPRSPTQVSSLGGEPEQRLSSTSLFVVEIHSRNRVRTPVPHVTEHAAQSLGWK
jgi:hypothetical protein